MGKPDRGNWSGSRRAGHHGLYSGRPPGEGRVSAGLFPRTLCLLHNDGSDGRRHVGMLVKNNLVKKLIGMSIFQSAVILFFVAGASKHGATVPILEETLGLEDASLYANPLPHTLMLTAIVVSVATTGVALAILQAIYKRHGTLEEDEVMERMQE